MSDDDIVRNDRITIGVIRKAIGLQGVCAVEAFGTTLKHLSLPVSVHIGVSEHESTVATLEMIECRPKGPVCRFSDVETAEQAEALRGRNIYISRKYLPKLEDDAYYHFDLIGLKVRNEIGQELGFVIAVHNFPSVDSVEVSTGRDTLMLPLTGDAVIDIDQTTGYLTVRSSFLDELL